MDDERFTLFGIAGEIALATVVHFAAWLCGYRFDPHFYLRTPIGPRWVRRRNSKAGILAC